MIYFLHFFALIELELKKEYLKVFLNILKFFLNIFIFYFLFILIKNIIFL